MPEIAVTSKTGDNDVASMASSVAEEVPLVGKPNPKKQCSIAEAWARKEVHSELRKSKARAKEQYLFVHCNLYCDVCFDHGDSTIAIGDDKYFTACLRDKWFELSSLLDSLLYLLMMHISRRHHLKMLPIA